MKNQDHHLPKDVKLKGDAHSHTNSIHTTRKKDPDIVSDDTPEVKKSGNEQITTTDKAQSDE
ncbi:MAG: hypothetical protein H0U75_09075 [Legionella sp.]|nr:hypothetical protein [Legionella sp.]